MVDISCGYCLFDFILESRSFKLHGLVDSELMLIDFSCLDHLKA